MTTEQTMLGRALRGAGRRVLTACIAAAALAVGLCPAGCAGTKERLVAPRTLMAPYDTAAGDVLWAVAPLRNETGTTLADAYEVSDKVVAAASQVQGVRVVPLNRTIAAMRALRMSDLKSPAEVRQLASELGVDGVIVGSITAWDPYDPPKIGISVALFAREGRLRTGDDWLDPVALEMAYTDCGLAPAPASAVSQAPASVVAGHLDGANHETLMEVRRYAEGRHDYDAALGWRRDLASMDLYTDFAAYWAVRGLLDKEQLRLARLVRQTTQASRP